MAWYSRFQFILSNGRQVSAAGSYWSVRSIYPQLLIGVGSVESSFWPPMTNIFSSGSCTTLARERVGARLLRSVQVFCTWSYTSTFTPGWPGMNDLYPTATTWPLGRSTISWSQWSPLGKRIFGIVAVINTAVRHQYAEVGAAQGFW